MGRECGGGGGGGGKGGGGGGGGLPLRAWAEHRELHFD